MRRIEVSIVEDARAAAQCLTPTEARELADQLVYLADTVEHHPARGGPKLLLPLPTGQLRACLMGDPR